MNTSDEVHGYLGTYIVHNFFTHLTWDPHPQMSFLILNYKYSDFIHSSPPPYLILFHFWAQPPRYVGMSHLIFITRKVFNIELECRCRCRWIRYFICILVCYVSHTFRGLPFTLSGSLICFFFSGFSHRAVPGMRYVVD